MCVGGDGGVFILHSLSHSLNGYFIACEALLVTHGASCPGGGVL